MIVDQLFVHARVDHSTDIRQGQGTLSDVGREDEVANASPTARLAFTTPL